MKMRIGFIVVLLCLILNGNSFGFSFAHVNLISDNRQEGWSLKADIGILNAIAPERTYSWDETIFYPMVYYSWGSYEGYEANVSEDSSISPPSSFNGDRFIFRVTDGGDEIQMSGVVSGLTQAPLSTNLSVLDYGIHPTISWHNPSTTIGHYKVRVLDKNDDLIWQSSALDYSSYGNDPVYSINGFDFLPNEEYFIRIEAREPSIRFQDILGDIPDWEGITNRSTVIMPYLYNSQMLTRKELYDDFSDSRIDMERWQRAEFVRKIDQLQGKLISKLASYSGDKRNTLNFKSPESIYAIETSIIMKESQIDSGNNTSVFARVDGIFYNVQPSGGAAGDIWAGIKISESGSGLEAIWEIEEALDDNLSTWESRGNGILVPLGNLEYDVEYKVKIEYKKDTNQFEFTVGNQSINLSTPIWARPEVTKYKALDTGINSDLDVGVGYIQVLFDDVFLNNEATEYDTFSTVPINVDKWSSYCKALEISAGKLRLGAQALDGRSTEYNALSNTETNYLEAKVTFESDSQLSPGATGRARVNGIFYNEMLGPGSGLPYNGYEGDVWFNNRIMYDGYGNLWASALVLRYDEASRGGAFTVLLEQNFTTPIYFDTEYTISIDYKDSVVVFKCNDENIPYVINTSIYPPYDGFKWLESRVWADAGGSGYMNILFDDIYIEDICNGTLDSDTDIDGSDLALYILNPMDVSLEDFAADFGRTDCR